MIRTKDEKPKPRPPMTPELKILNKRVDEAIAASIANREQATGKPFLLKLSPKMEEKIEVERIHWGLKSRAATIRKLLEKALKG